MKSISSQYLGLAEAQKEEQENKSGEDKNEENQQGQEATPLNESKISDQEAKRWLNILKENRKKYIQKKLKGKK